MSSIAAVWPLLLLPLPRLVRLAELGVLPAARFADDVAVFKAADDDAPRIDRLDCSRCADACDARSAADPAPVPVLLPTVEEEGAATEEVAVVLLLAMCCSTLA